MYKLIRITLNLFVVVIGAAAYAQPATPLPSVGDSQVVAQLKDAKWTAPTYTGVPPGIMVWYVAGDPKGGPAINYGKFPAGYAFPRHWHSYPEFAVLVSGTARYVIAGQSFDLSPGSLVIIPAKVPHELTCSQAGPCIFLFQWRREGPPDFHFEK